jgi:hypothetical protein
MSITDKIRNGEEWDIKLQEERAREHYFTQIDTLDRAIAMGRRMSAIASTPGFTDFIQAVKDAHSYADGQLVVSKDPYETARLQGRVSALRDIVGLMTDNEQRLSELDKRRQMLQDQASAIFRPDGKVKTGVDLDG